jgi:hypothetical protein
VTQQQTRVRSFLSGTLKQPARKLLREMPLLVLLFSLTGQLTLASAAPALSADAPEAVVDITSRDLGDVFAGEELEYAFIVRNAGTKPLELAEKRTASSESSSESTRAAYILSVAMWRPAARLSAQPAAAVRAAPS